MTLKTKNIIKGMINNATPFIEDLSNEDKQKQKLTQKICEASFEFALSFYEIGKAHKAEERTKLNFEQFMYFNKFNDLDFAKEDVSAPKRKELTEEFIKLVIYPAYEGGYNGTTLF